MNSWRHGGVLRLFQTSYQLAARLSLQLGIKRSVEIAVISDLHLGSDEPTDSFGHDDGEFLRFLLFLERNFERIVLLGDIWETLTFPCPFRTVSAFHAARARHPEIARRLLSERYVYIHGNHDAVAYPVLGAPEQWLLHACGKRILFTHGHAYDRLARWAQRLAELGVCVGGWLQRFGFTRLYGCLEKIERASTRVSMDPRLCRFQAWAVDEAERQSADLIVTGHTHLPARSDHGKTLYLNSGSCSNGRTTFLAMNLRRDTYGVHHSW